MPRAMIFVLVSNLAAVLLAFSRVGTWLALGIPLQALVGFQAFRLPLELILHSWAKQGTIPITMTWEGSNFDVVSGILALCCAPLVGRFKITAWIANGVGFVLLLNVGRVAILSSPFPFAWPVSPPLLLAFHLPYAWIVPVCVSGALAGHIILTRALVQRGKQGE
jgi:hypothetical protein